MKKINYTALKAKLMAVSHKKFADDAAYILSGDLDKILWRSEEKAGREKIADEVIAKIKANPKNADAYAEEILGKKKAKKKLGSGGAVANTKPKPVSYTEDEKRKGFYTVLFSDGEKIVVDFTLPDLVDLRKQSEIFAFADRNYKSNRNEFKGGGEIDKQYSIEVEFKPADANYLIGVLENLLGVKITDNSMFDVSDSKITVYGLSKKEEEIVFGQLHADSKVLNCDSQEMMSGGGKVKQVERVEPEKTDVTKKASMVIIAKKPCDHVEYKTNITDLAKRIAHGEGTKFDVANNNLEPLHVVDTPEGEEYKAPAGGYVTYADENGKEYFWTKDKAPEFEEIFGVNFDEVLGVEKLAKGGEVSGDDECWCFPLLYF